MSCKALLVGSLSLCLMTPNLHAWEFSEAVDVTNTGGQNYFHHLESSGRRNLAVSDEWVAITWEDDRSGIPSVYVALKDINNEQFSREIKLSASGDAFEPAITALPGGLFIVSWEENELSYARIVSAERTEAALQLSSVPSSQSSSAKSDNSILLVLAERSNRYSQVKLYQLEQSAEGRLSIKSSCPVDRVDAKADQLFPVIAIQQNNIVVAWEDRRHGHTIIMASQSTKQTPCSFSDPVRISEKTDGPKMPYGEGHGVARVALSPYGSNSLFAAWADKRNFQEGYDIYGAHNFDGRGFVDNVRVQDDFGGKFRQWHSSVTGLPDGTLVVAWTDERDDTADIWYSWLEDGEFSDDSMIDSASGAGEQTHPSIFLDSEGNIHATWVEREKPGGPTRLRYSWGKKP